jgi:hypothetical protein
LQSREKVLGLEKDLLARERNEERTDPLSFSKHTTFKIFYGGKEDHIIYVLSVELQGAFREKE